QWVNVECDVVSLPYVCTKTPLDFSASQPAGCPVNSIYSPGDEMYSPSFPSPPGISSCEYLLLDLDVNTKARVEITFFESNFCCDTLTIYDDIFGTNVHSTLSGYHPNQI
ncbi:hypothetical protein PFISCL1PPCAC_17012, partial [Pristionchus fissidentatus]